MRTIIAGSRNIIDFTQVQIAISQCDFIAISTIISGGARGVDSLAIQYAKLNNIPIETYLADWNKYGKSAGYKRNILMSKNADALIAIWDGNSKGTKHMIDTAIKANLIVFTKLIRS